MKENLIKAINEQIGDTNPTLYTIAHIISDDFSYTYEEAFKIASGIIMQRAGIKLVNNYDPEVIASLIGKDLIEIANSIFEAL